MKAFRKITSMLLALLMILTTGAAMLVTTSAADNEFAPEADGFYYIDDKADWDAFVAAVNADTSTYFSGKTVKLRADIDLADTTYTRFVFTGEFRGNIDGQGHAIKNLTVVNNTAKMGGMINVIRDSVIENISFLNMSVTGNQQDMGGIAAYAANKVTFRNVYAQGVVAGTYHVGGFLSRVMGSGRVIEFYNCVSDLNVQNPTSNGAAGFLSNIEMGNTVRFFDCAFIGNLTTTASVVAGFVGFTKGNVELTRCVNLGKGVAGTYKGGLVFLDHTNDANVKAGKAFSNIVITDCYSAGAQNLNPVGISNGRGFGFNLTLNYGGKTVFSHRDEDTKPTTAAAGIYGKLADVNAALTAAGAYLANGATVNVTAKNFAEKCPALAANNWVVTADTVEYATGLNFPKVLPRGIATDAMTAPSETGYLQIRDNGAKYDVRFVGTVNFADLDSYAFVGFAYSVKVKGAETALVSDSVKTQKIFDSIIADGVNVTAENLKANGLNVIQFSNFADGVAYEISITAFAEMADGTVIYDYAGATTVTVQDGAKL